MDYEAHAKNFEECLNDKDDRQWRIYFVYDLIMFCQRISVLIVIEGETYGINYDADSDEMLEHSILMN